MLYGKHRGTNVKISDCRIKIPHASFGKKVKPFFSSRTESIASINLRPACIEVGTGIAPIVLKHGAIGVSMFSDQIGKYALRGKNA